MSDGINDCSGDEYRYKSQSTPAPERCPFEVGQAVFWNGQDGQVVETITKITEPQPGNWVLWCGEFPINYRQVRLWHDAPSGKQDSEVDMKENSLSAGRGMAEIARKHHVPIMTIDEIAAAERVEPSKETAREWLKKYLKLLPPKPKPTIAELEALLADTSEKEVIVLPDGGIIVEPPDWAVSALEAYTASLRADRDKWKRRALKFQAAWKDADFEAFALKIQKMELESLGDQAMRVQRDRAREKARQMIQLSNKRWKERAESAEQERDSWKRATEELTTEKRTVVEELARVKQALQTAVRLLNDHAIDWSRLSEMSTSCRVCRGYSVFENGISEIKHKPDCKLVEVRAALAERKRVQELEGALKRLIECPAMIYTSFSGNPDIEQRVHKQCICCTAHKGQPHIEGCHIAEAESLLAKEQTK